MRVAAVRAPSEHALQAVRNTLKLGASLMVTVGIALVARVVLLPRYLGPEQFGALNFSETFSTATFALIAFGADMYIQKEIAVRPQHASDFYGGLLGLRLLCVPLVLGGMAVALWGTGQLHEVGYLVALFAAYQFFVQHNNTLAALLRAKGDVGGLSVQNVVSKLVWGVGMVWAASAGLGLGAIAMAYILPEALKTVSLGFLVRRHLHIELKWDPRALKAMLVASLPFYLNGLALTGYANLDRFLLRTIVGEDAEVGYYAAAANLGGLALLPSPIITWVLMPLLSRALAQSEEEFFHTLRRALEVLLITVLPLSVALGLGADVWIRIPGPEYGPSVPILRTLAPVYIFTYTNALAALGLITLGRGWRTTTVSLCGLLLNPVLNLALVGPVRAALEHQPGSGGMATALAMLLSEASVCVGLLVLIGPRIFDRRSLGMVARNALCCALIVVLHVALQPLGAPRLALDAAAFVVLVLLLRAVPFREASTLLREALRRRRPGPDAAA